MKKAKQTPRLLGYGGIDQESEIAKDNELAATLPNEFEVRNLPITDSVLIHRPPTFPLTAEQCCNLAAWLVHLAPSRDAKTSFNRKLRLLNLLCRK